ncbi:urate hydroxylase PuuD [Denitratisoma sp. agr-D3]
MEAYVIEWASMLLRWLHLIVGIAWIGSSFYFVWLDNSLRPPEDEELKRKGVAGELWAVHGGGFYNPQKYLVAPAFLPKELHWFKWEAYSTWITGFLLISTLYYFQAGSWMVDPAKAALTPAMAVGIGLLTLGGGWLVYDQLCRILIDRSQLLFGVIYYGFVVLVAWGLSHLISGRAAYLHVGAMIATTMSANVFFWIIPGQKKTIAQMQRGEQPDPIHGKRAKQRSLHNNYLTLPVLFCMISNHYAFTYGHAHAWAVLALVLLAAVLIRHFFNLRHKEIVQWRYPLAGGAILLAVAFWLAPAAAKGEAPLTADEQVQVAQVIAQRCAVCHAEHPTLMPAAPAGVLLDSPARIEVNKARILVQAVQLKAMPLGNVTAMRDDERALLARWGAAAKP